MPLEGGGRADKFGNRYEGRWVLKQLLRLVKEEIINITLEAVGREEEGIDLWIENKDGSRVCCQCKARNGSEEHWTIGDLGAKGIFQKAKKQLDFSETITYHFVSAVSCMMLNDITNRARNSNDNPRDFYDYQIKNSKEVHKEYNKIVEHFGLNHSSETDRDRVFYYLKRMHIIHFSDDLETKKTLKETIEYLFVGNPEVVYNLLLNYPIENDLLGKKISIDMITNFLKGQVGISFRQLHKDERIMPRIEHLNVEFESDFPKINDSLIHRQESDRCYRELLNEHSVIIRGTAGSGKSGCVIDLINKLKEENIVYLALKLDRRVPNGSSNKYGEELELSASPVFCIDAVSKNKAAVLILDQLDAIRWTNSHSNTALAVCKQMISEVNNINKERDRKISLVFVCRTFDFQNDNSIKQLFSKTNANTKEIPWKEIIMNDLDNESVKGVVGEAYNDLSNKLITLLKTPSNLYIWSNLEEERRNNIYISSRELIEQWWKQLSINGEKLGISNKDMNDLKNTVVQQIDNSGKLMIPKQFINHCSKHAAEYLQSNGLLSLNSSKVGFVHQSFYDYFLVEKMFLQIFEGNSINSILGPTFKQTPSKRYQLQMLLENLLDYDLDNFVDVGFELLNSEDMRFYMKYVFLEVLGQAESINSKVEEFLKQYIESSFWRNHLFDSVFNNHPIFIKFLIREGYILKWLDSEQNRNLALNLLRTVNCELTDEITSLLRPLAFMDPELDNNIYTTLCWDIAHDSDDMFEFRLELLKFRPQIDEYISWEQLAQHAPDRALRLLDEMIKHVNKDAIEERHDLDEKALKILAGIATDRSQQVWDSFMPYIAKSTRNITSNSDSGLDFWSSKQYREQMYGRTYIEMVKYAVSELIKIDPGKLTKNCEVYYENTSPVINEILLYMMEKLPTDYSDYVLNWLLEEPYRRFFDYTGEYDEYLFSTKKIIAKHSKNCSDELFGRLERVLYYYHEENELKWAKSRFKTNRENRDKEILQVAYWHYWGEVQDYLLPALDQNRISKYTYELKRILERRFMNQVIRRHTRNKIYGGSVSSTIQEKAEKVSDRQWLRIIKKSDYQKDRWSLSDGPILESSPEQFSRDFERVGRQNPKRFAELALNFPEDVDDHYVQAIFSIIGEDKAGKGVAESEEWEPVKLNLAQVLYKKWGIKENINIAMAFCRGLEKRSEEPWDKDILSQISYLARNHSHPEEGKQNVVFSRGENGETVEFLWTNSLNCVRGCAGIAIASLIWEDSDRYEFLKDVVESIVKDANLAVNMAAIQCIISIIDIDENYATQWFFYLANKDLRIVAHPYAYDLFDRLYKGDPKCIKKLVLEMYNSKFEDVARAGARHVGHMNILYGCFEDIIFSHGNSSCKSKVQKEGILKVAIDFIGHQNYHEKCKTIITHLLDGKNDGINLFVRLLSTEKLNLQEDAEFILKLVTANFNIRGIIRKFVDFINEHDTPIKIFKEIIFSICQKFLQRYKQGVNDVGRELYGIAPGLSNLIASLYDETQGNVEDNQRCLDIWDEMFENGIGTIRELTKTIMDA